MPAADFGLRACPPRDELSLGRRRGGGTAAGLEAATGAGCGAAAADGGDGSYLKFLRPLPFVELNVLASDSTGFCKNRFAASTPL